MASASQEGRFPRSGFITDVVPSVFQAEDVFYVSPLPAHRSFVDGTDCWVLQFWGSGQYGAHACWASVPPQGSVSLFILRLGLTCSISQAVRPSAPVSPLNSREPVTTSLC